MKLHTPRGFTILEVLVASAILAVILVIMLQVTHGIMQATLIQNQQMYSVASARRAMDVMAMDIEQGVVGNNAAILASSATNLVLLTSRGGPAGSAGHRFLAVSYSKNGTDFFRSYGSVAFTTSATDLLAAATNSTTIPAEPLAKGILGLSIRALADASNAYDISGAAAANWATNSYNGMTPPAGFQAIITATPSFASGLTNRTRALEVWIAAVDEQNLKILGDTSTLGAAQAALGSEPALWRDQIDAASIPAQTKAAIRILKKTIPTP